MMAAPSHRDIQDCLPALALDALEGSELAEVTDHLRDCQACADLLREYRAAAAGLALALPRESWPPEQAQRVRARLLDRVHAGRHASASSSGNTTGAMLRWSGWLVAAGLGGVLLIHHSIHRPVEYGWMAAGALWLALVGIGIYAWTQRRRVAALEAAARSAAAEARDPTSGRSA